MRSSVRDTRRPARRRRSEPDWVELPDKELLALRLCDLKLTLEHTDLGLRVEQLYDELAARKLRFRPHCWLSDEWFSPDGIPGFGIPFYLAHRRLMKLEDSIKGNSSTIFTVWDIEIDIPLDMGLFSLEELTW